MNGLIGDRALLQGLSLLQLSCRQWRQALLSAAMLPWVAVAAQAQSIAPANDGTGSIVTQTGPQYTIHGGSLSRDGANLFHSFQRFGLSPTEIANFQANPNLRNILSRVVGGDPSYIHGLLQVTGGAPNLFLMNPAGIVFGPTAQLNVPAAFMATTANSIGVGCGAGGVGCSGWFSAAGPTPYADLVGAPNAFTFAAAQPGSIANLGTLAVGDGQSLTLLGGTVLNAGTLIAPNGQVTIAAVPGQNLVRVSQPGSLLSLEFSPFSTPALPAPLALPALLTGAGLNNANGVTVNSDGTIQLSGAGSAIASGAGTAIVSGQISVASSTASAATAQIAVVGEQVALRSATLDASGVNGGSVRVGGDYLGQGAMPNARLTDVDATSVLRADGTTSGNGGRVIVWADDTTRFAGTITARGGMHGGNGGLVETSGKQTLMVAPTAIADTTAPAGLAGTWLLDPTSITIVPSGGTDGSVAAANANPGASTIDFTVVNTALGLGNVVLTATDFITVDPGTALTIPGASSLSLNAPTINLNAAIAAPTATSLQGTATVANVGAGGTVQNGVDVVTAGGTVNLAAATYTLANTVNLAKSITVNGVNAASTTISGNNAVQVFNVSGATTNASLNNLTITQGNTVANGGGIALNLGSSLTVNNSTIANNTANFGGGISVNNNGSQLTINNSLIANNTATGGPGGGGGIFVDVVGSAVDVNNSVISGNRTSGGGSGAFLFSYGTVNVTNSTITGNVSTSAGGAIVNRFGTSVLNITDSLISGNTTINDGGGLFNDGTARIVNSTISGNTAGSNGGGIITNPGSTLSLSNSVLSNNAAARFGGGITSLQGTTTITNTTISNNVSGLGDGGGGIFNEGGSTLTVANSTFSGNQGRGGNGGGGILNSGTLTVTNSTFVGNAAPVPGGNGGGGLTNFGTVRIDSSTFSGNSTTGWGGGINNFGGLAIASSIISGNTAVLGAEINSFPMIASGGNNLFGFNGNAGLVNVTAIASDLTPTVPLNQILAPLSNNGGLTQTMALVIGSPAVNRAGATATTGDQRGVPAVGVRDIGAFELAEFVWLPLTGEGQSTLINTTFANPLQVQLVEVTSRQAIALANLAVTFSVPSSGASGVFNGAPTVLSNAQGIATSPFLTANDIAGNFSVAANSTGISGATFNLSNTLPPPRPLPPSPPSSPPVSAPLLPPKDAEFKELQQTVEPRSPFPTAVPVAVGSILDTGFDTVEANATGQFANHLELTEKPASISLPEAQATLQRVAVASGIRPALIYVSFVNPTDQAGECATSTKPYVQRDPATGDVTLTGASCQSADLQLLLLTATGKVIRQRVPDTTRQRVLETALIFRNEVADPSKTRTRSYLPTAQQLHRWLISPLEAELKAAGIGTLVFVMDSGLRGIPLAAIHDGNSFLIERYSLGLMPSLSLTDTRYTDVRTTQVLAAGATQFTDQNPLPAVSVELSAVTSQWQGQALFEQAFTLNNLIAERQKRPFGIIHLATHGQFLPGAIANSYIQLANDRLSLGQVRQLGWADPPVELVVLSACEMAVGDDTAELGFAGFAVKAGAKSALASLWSVSDQSTAGLMAEFYEALRQKPIKAEAVRQAQLEMLRGNVRVEQGKLIWSNGAAPLPESVQLRNQSLSHPYHWAAFTLIGSPW